MTTDSNYNSSLLYSECVCFSCHCVVTFMSYFIKGTIRILEMNKHLSTYATPCDKTIKFSKVQLKSPSFISVDFSTSISLLYELKNLVRLSIWLCFYLKFNRNNLQFNLSLVEGNVVVFAVASIFYWNCLVVEEREWVRLGGWWRKQIEREEKIFRLLG
jgi:hypothetical protein